MKSLLCLGDSYTIGEALPEKESFPFQLVAQLKNKGISFFPPEIVAKTGWTTQETLEAMKLHSFKKWYDWVTVLSGVNNQYRGHSIESYKTEFNHLLNWALELAGGYSHHVIVLSIPDWGCTPFAHDRDVAKISLEIDLFNSANRQMADEKRMHYVDICQGSRLAKDHGELVAADGLHPSAEEYARWAKLLAIIIGIQA